MSSVALGAGVWKSGRGKGRPFPKGRQLDDTALAEVQALLGDRPRRRDLLIEFLHLIQDRWGHISAARLMALADEMRLSQAEVYEVATFYAHFDVVKEGETPPPPLTIRVCDSLSCELAGAQALKAALESQMDSSQIRVLRAPCMGQCDRAPAVEIGHFHLGHATTDRVAEAVAAGRTEPVIPDYEDLAAYRAKGGYSALADLRASRLTPEAMRDALLASGLRGCGGAGFPTGRKFDIVRSYPGPRYLAVNGDEGEPGTFKDRYYMERWPHLILEGTLLAATGIEAERAFLYIRDEYGFCTDIIRREIAALEKEGVCDQGFLELRRGAGAYICGEESAMLESIEGKRGLPRHRPPYVAESGLFGRPTLVHNIETFYWIARVVREGPAVLAGRGHSGCTGLRSFSVSGRVRDPGVYVLEAGSTLRDLISAAGGLPEGHTLRAFQPGGPSSGILPASLQDLPLDHDALQAHGSFLGSAAVVVLSQVDTARDAALNMLRFFEDESCGQCTPCRVGCTKAVALMEAERWDQSLLEDLCEVMGDASICGLGQAAVNPIRHVIAHFPGEIS